MRGKSLLPSEEFMEEKKKHQKTYGDRIKGVMLNTACMPLGPAAKWERDASVRSAETQKQVRRAACIPDLVRSACYSTACRPKGNHAMAGWLPVWHGVSFFLRWYSSSSLASAPFFPPFFFTFSLCVWEGRLEFLGVRLVAGCSRGLQLQSALRAWALSRFGLTFGDRSGHEMMASN